MESLVALWVCAPCDSLIVVDYPVLVLLFVIANRDASLPPAGNIAVPGLLFSLAVYGCSFVEAKPVFGAGFADYGGCGLLGAICTVLLLPCPCMLFSFFILSIVSSSFGFVAVFPLRPDGPRVVIGRLSVVIDALVLSFSAPAFALSSFCSWIVVSSFFVPLVINGVALWDGAYRALKGPILFVFVRGVRFDFIPDTPVGFYVVFWVFGYAAASLFRISGSAPLRTASQALY